MTRPYYESFLEAVEDALPRLHAAADELAAAFGMLGGVASEAAVRALRTMFEAVDWDAAVRAAAVNSGVTTEVDIRNVYYADGEWWVRTWNHRKIPVMP